MKKSVAFLTVILLLAINVKAQKFAYVNTQYILNKIPAYKEAKRQLDKISEKYQKEVENTFDEVENMKEKYEDEKVLLSKEMREKREKAIRKKRNEAKQLKQKYFGDNGLLSQKRKELIQPIQDEIYKSIKEIANERNYAIIFDSASGATVLYTNPRYDKSDQVLEKLGYK